MSDTIVGSLRSVLVDDVYVRHHSGLVLVGDIYVRHHSRIT